MINSGWDKVLKNEMEREYFRKLGSFVKKAYKNGICYPDYANIFNALRYTDYENVGGCLSFLSILKILIHNPPASTVAVEKSATRKFSFFCR